MHPFTNNLRIVLVGTQHPGNIGSTARAMKTMGWSDLHLVTPERFPDREANALAAGADDVLEAAGVHDSLDTALAGCQLVLGTTARRRAVPMPEFTPREAAERLMTVVAAGKPVALVFGRERTGLENEELQRCQGAVSIPANPGYSSLNLAAAVQILCYELRLAALERLDQAPAPVIASTEAPASNDQMERYFTHLLQTLDDIDFHKGREPGILMQRLRRLYLRAAPDERELRILHGILADTQRMARLARGS